MVDKLTGGKLGRLGSAFDGKEVGRDENDDTIAGLEVGGEEEAVVVEL